MVQDRKDAIEAIASRDETDGTVKVFTGREVNEILSALPSADAVEVVRCKDCKYRRENCGMGDHRWCDVLKMTTMADDFCSYGKRREP